MQKGGIGPPGERKWSLRGIGDLGFEDYSNLLAAERRREHGHADEIVLRRGLVHLTLHGTGAFRRKQHVVKAVAFGVQLHDDDGFVAAERGLASLCTGKAVTSLSSSLSDFQGHRPKA